MKKRVKALGRFLRRNPWAAGILGFLSPYFIWMLPSLPFLLNWGEWWSYAYAYGDTLVLPLFDSLSFWMIAKHSKRPPKHFLLGAAVVTLAACAALIAFFEPNASAALKKEELPTIVVLWHSVFILLQFSFIIFMLCVYCFSWWAWAYAPLWASTLLFGLVAIFLGFVHIADAWFHNFGYLEKIGPFAFLTGAYIWLVLDHKKLRSTGKKLST